MHKNCVDAWLVNNPSCPSCRHSLSDLIDDTPLMQLRTLRSRLSSRPSIRRFWHHHSDLTLTEPRPQEEVVNGHNGSEVVVDQSVLENIFISTLELLEEASNDSNQNDTVNENDIELANAQRRLQRDRTSRMATIRRNLALMRSRERASMRQRSSVVPLAEPDSLT